VPNCDVALFKNNITQTAFSRKKDKAKPPHFVPLFALHAFSWKMSKKILLILGRFLSRFCRIGVFMKFEKGP
jgi:hypothetical protein